MLIYSFIAYFFGLVITIIVRKYHWFLLCCFFGTGLQTWIWRPACVENIIGFIFNNYHKENILILQFALFSKLERNLNSGPWPEVRFEVHTVVLQRLCDCTVWPKYLKNWVGWGWGRERLQRVWAEFRRFSKLIYHWKHFWIWTKSIIVNYSWLH